jgi:hypothetical protein
MKRNRPSPLGFVILAIVASLCGLILTAPTSAQSNQLKKLVGEWELSTKADPSDKRLIAFMISNQRVTGTYTTEAGETLPITGITFANGKYSFRVSNKPLIFRDLKFVGNNLEGVGYFNAEEKVKSVPRVVQMVRKSTR